MFVANFLMEEFPNVAKINGGINAWKNRKLPYAAFKHPRKPAGYTACLYSSNNFYK